MDKPTQHKSGGIDAQKDHRCQICLLHGYRGAPILIFLRIVGKALIFSLCSLMQAGAAEIDVVESGTNAPSMVFFNGDIVDGDAAKFDQLTSNIGNAVVVLQSNGGLVRDALAIGSNIRLHNYSTLVGGNDGCYSACALIWVAGAKRYMTSDAVVGVHAAYVEREGVFTESGVGNAEIGSYLTYVGLRIEAIRFFTTSGPDSFSIVTPDVARAIGLEVFVLENGSVVSPQQAPTADAYALSIVSIAAMRGLCSGYFQPERSILEMQAKQIAKAGQILVGNNLWVELWSRAADALNARAATDGALTVCLQIEASLRYQGVSTGVKGPSFPCENLGEGIEAVLCTSPELWAKDRAMDAIYLEVRKISDAKARKRILADQRNWMAQRNSCSNDVSCIAAAYDERLFQFRQVYISGVP